MTSIPASRARSKFYKLLDLAAASDEPIRITGKRSNAILVSEDAWRGIHETLYLLSIPGMQESIRTGIAVSLDKTFPSPGW
jgi:antitoxin YefM